MSGPEAQPVKAYLAASVLKLRMEAVDGLARSSRPKEALFISSFFQGGACEEGQLQRARRSARRGYGDLLLPAQISCATTH